MKALGLYFHLSVINKQISWWGSEAGIALNTGLHISHLFACFPFGPIDLSGPWQLRTFDISLTWDDTLLNFWVLGRQKANALLVLLRHFCPAAVLQADVNSHTSSVENLLRHLKKQTVAVCFPVWGFDTTGFRLIHGLLPIAIQSVFIFFFSRKI